MFVSLVGCVGIVFTWFECCSTLSRVAVSGSDLLKIAHIGDVVGDDDDENGGDDDDDDNGGDDDNDDNGDDGEDNDDVIV